MKTKESAFVVSARENLRGDEEEFIVVGAYLSFGDAVQACVDTIIDRMAVHEIAATMRNDESRMPGWNPPETDAAWRVFIEHELVTQHCYYPKSGGTALRYDIDEVDIVGHGGHGGHTENRGRAADKASQAGDDGTYEGMKRRGKVEVVAAMDALLHHLHDEEALVPWLSDGVPDDMDHDVFPRDVKAKLDEYTAAYGDLSDEDFEDMVRLFATIVRRACFKTTYRKKAFF